jgi:hypothetical protein
MGVKNLCACVWVVGIRATLCVVVWGARVACEWATLATEQWENDCRVVLGLRGYELDSAGRSLLVEGGLTTLHQREIEALPRCGTMSFTGSVACAVLFDGVPALLPWEESLFRMAERCVSCRSPADQHQPLRRSSHDSTSTTCSRSTIIN